MLGGVPPSACATLQRMQASRVKGYPAARSDDGVKMKKPSTQLTKPVPSGKSGGHSVAILPSDLGAQLPGGLASSVRLAAPAARRRTAVRTACHGVSASC
ncbi:protein of unknown function (plasmid) [Cupriavidus taiwanensis]|uniref:Uncharacterized protein n=1 Tax=Cupriavidus taiwanensis TaxID=164546 RepID=A0A375IRB0_9BURK|nr:protein of unknown function [Cupriavidus taiwanensis]